MNTTATPRNFAHWLNDNFEAAKFGGKARALASLSRAGFAVPEWCALRPRADPTPDEIMGELFLRFPAHCRFAVRSSARDEDGADHLLAGQLSSFLDVPLEGVTEKIAAVRRSGFSRRVVTSRRQAGLSLPPPMPGVIVQQMVAADCAGIAFSADPVSGRRGLAVVSAVPGLGDALVAGEETGDSFHVDRTGEITHRVLLETAEPVLTDEQARTVAALARQAAQHFGAPQEIEWAFADGQLWLLQSRPITALRTLPDPDGALKIWDNSAIAESYSGLTTPLTFSFARQVYEEGYSEFVGILGVPAAQIDAHRDVFARLLGFIRGRIYGNLLDWYRVLALLPGFVGNRRFIEQMMGVKEELTPELLAEILPPKRQGALTKYRDLTRLIFGLRRAHRILPQKIREFSAQLEDARRDSVPALSACRPDELAAAYRGLQRRLFQRWDTPLINDFLATIYLDFFRRFAERWCGDTRAALQNELLAGRGGMISTEAARNVREMAALVREEPALGALLRLKSLDEIQRNLAAFPAFDRAFHEYLEDFGDRCFEEMKLESATLHEDPLLLLRAVGQLANRSPARLPNSDASASAEQRVREKMRGHPLRAAIFRFVLQRARDRVRDRENLRFERARIFGRVRRIFVELGHRLHALGVLDNSRDVFFLAAEETLAFVEGTALGTDLRALAAARQAEFARYAAEPDPADRFSTRGTVYLGHDLQNFRRAEPPPSETLQGLGCSPGVRRGLVRIVLDPRQADFEAGEILVLHRPDPGWIILFSGAAGLLVEHGTTLSHSAVVAREMRLPTIVALPGLTAWLRTGNEVELDGAAGTVTRLRHAAD